LFDLKTWIPKILVKARLLKISI